MASSDADPIGRVLESSGLALERARLLGSRRPVVVAVSGGADSLCLLDAMVTLLEGARLRVIVGHVDHRLRPDSASDAEHVRAIADGYGLRCEVLTVDVPALATAERRGVEDAARLGRYRALRDIDAATAPSVVVTGHTRDDSVETVMLHLLRGSGPRGLAGIRAEEMLNEAALGEAWTLSQPKVLRLVRPLLKVSRADTVAYCQARGIRWLTDATNADPTFLRNRIRGHLLPVLRTYNPAIDDALDRLSLVSRDDEEFLHDEATRRFLTIARMEGNRLLLDPRRWKRLPVSMQRRLVRIVAARFGYDEIGFEAVERALAVSSEGGPPRAELGGGLTVEHRADTLIFERSQKVDDG